MANISNGFYSFPSGNVTYNGVSLGSTATYRTSVDFLVNGVRFLERRCENNAWKPPEVVISVAGECPSIELLTMFMMLNCSSRISGGAQSCEILMFGVMMLANKDTLNGGEQISLITRNSHTL